MKFSIIMASYNQNKFVEQAIESVLNQTYKNFELIIIDGKSTDGTIDIINKYNNHKNIKIIIESDKGMYHARNKGLLIASGDIIGFLNTDDFYESTALANIAASFKSNENISLIYGITHIINSKGNIINKGGVEAYNKDYRIVNNRALPDPSTFFSRKDLSLIGLYDLSFKIVADWDFWQKAMILNLNIQNVENHIANYRVYDEALSYNPKFEQLRFLERKRLYKKYNKNILSKIIINMNYNHFIIRPLKKIPIINYLFYKMKSIIGDKV